ncbi:uncharacterized protein TNCV_2719561 [Trichonephila clavipes]|nr:uncharacterized protein TNCV_2719561 [Trichonephila clavipes]
MEFEQRYFDLKLKFQDKIDAIDASRSINVSGQNISIAIPTEQSNDNFRLPKLTYQYSRKFQYLKGLLSDEPASLIKHIPLSNESYEEAWGKLIDRYDKKMQIVYALIKTFLYQKGISQVNMTNLRNLVDTSDEVLRGLKALGTEATNRDPWLIQILMQKLDTETKRLWSVKTAEREFPTLKEFLEFLNVRCSSLELMTCNDSDTKVPTKSNFIAGKNNPRSRSDKNCLKCSGVHKLFRSMNWAVGSLVVRASDSRPEGLGSMLDVTKYPPSAHGFTCRNCGGGDRGRVAIYRPFGEVSLSLNRTVTCMVLKANDRRTSCPCHDEFRGPRSDYVRQVALATTTTTDV